MGQTLTYKIIGGDQNSFFSINSVTGEISTSAGSKIDYESAKYYELIIQVTDDGPGRLTDTAAISIIVLDVNENPSFPRTERYVVENTPYNYIGNGAFENGIGVENEMGSYDGVSKEGNIIRCGNGAIHCGSRTLSK